MDTQTSKRNFLGLTCLLLAPLVLLSACGGGGGGSTGNGNAMPSLADRMMALESSLLGANGQFPKDSELSNIVDFPTGFGSYALDVLGYAYCEPANLLYQAPDPLSATETTTVYGCANNLSLDYSVPESSTVSITLSIPYIYIDASLDVLITDHEGYFSIENVTIAVEADIVSNPDGTFYFEGGYPPTVEFGTPTNLTIKTDDPAINFIISGLPIDDQVVEKIELVLSEVMQMELQKLKSFMF